MKYIFTLLCCVLLSNIYAQSLTLRNINDEYHELERLEMLSNRFAQNYNSTTKNIGAQEAIHYLDTLGELQLSKTDIYNKEKMIANNHEWDSDNITDYTNQKGVLKYFYKSRNNMYEANGKDYFVSINPVIGYQQGFETIDSSGNKFINSRGFEIKAHIKNKLFLYTQLTDNQERGPSYVQQFNSTMYQPSGVGYFKLFNKAGQWGGVDYTLARGYVGLEILKNTLQVSAGHDKFFIGDGYRSLMMGDNNTNMLFANIDLHFWKMHYKTLFFEMIPTFTTTADGLRNRKYAAMHHLAFNINSKLNIGFFEAVMFGRKDHFDFQYLNPVIFYRTIEQQLGSPDNALLGFDFKYLPIKHVQLYGQYMMDEFIFALMKSKTRDYRNKYAFQIGAKYINVAGIKNLDAQLEYNYIRPFMYSYKDSLADYTNYKQPLAHPNGANLTELIAILKYQPLPKLKIALEIIQRTQGLDSSANFSNGSNVFKSYTLHGSIYRFEMHNGILQTTTYFNLNASYELYRNFYLDAGLVANNINNSNVQSKSNYYYTGLRLNIERRKYNY
jgi:hypothetical protein